MKKFFLLGVLVGFSACSDTSSSKVAQTTNTIAIEQTTNVAETTTDLNTTETKETKETTEEKETEIEPEEEQGETIETYVQYDRQNFNGNPFDEKSGITKSIEPLIFDYLAIKNGSSDYTLKLLESYTLDNNILTLKIKPELLWCNLTPLDAYDVQTTLYCLFGFSDLWDNIESLTIVDDLTMELKLTSNDKTFLDKLFSYPICVQDDDLYLNFASDFAMLIENNRKLDSTTNKYVLDEGMKEKFNETIKATLEYKPDPVEMFMSGKYIILSWDENEIVFRASKGRKEQPKYYKVIGKWTENTADLEKALLDLKTILS